MITGIRARELAGHWHGGQWSSLYQFASSGKWIMENALLYLSEIQREIENPEYALRPFFRSQKNQKELFRLKRFFEDMAKREGIEIIWQSWKSYGTLWPVIGMPDIRCESILYPVRPI